MNLSVSFSVSVDHLLVLALGITQVKNFLNAFGHVPPLPPSVRRRARGGRGGRASGLRCCDR